MTGSRISVAAPDLGGRELEYVTECMTTGWISSNGRFIAEFEAAFAAFCDVKHAVAVSNGTVALHVALVALGVGPGDEVLVPDLTYIASANAVRYCGAEPIFIDNDRRTFNLDPDALEAKITPKTKGIIPVHLYGHPVDMDAVLDIARRHGLFVLEDAAEAIGATYKGRRVGGLGNCATFSFFGNKIITTGEGGMVTTNDDDLARQLRLLRGQGMDPERRYWFPVVGYNYRMTNIAAAIGLAQLERIDFHLAERKRVAEGYQRRLSKFSELLTLPFTETWAGHVFWMYTILINNPEAGARDQVISAMDLAGIETRPVFYPMHVMPPYAEPKGLYPNANWCAERGLNLPTHSGLSDQDLDQVVEALIKALR